MADLAGEYRSDRRSLDAAIRRVLSSGTYVLGPEVEAFEHAFATYCGAQYGIGVGSGTAALHLTLLAAGVGPGDEVITVPNTDSPTAAVVRHVGATVVFADVDPRTFNMDPGAAAAAITSRTRVILPVHLFGNPANLRLLVQLAKRHGLLLIEDGALAVGAQHDGNRVGSVGDAGCFSLAPGKILGGYGDAGIVVTSDRHLADRIRILRNYGHSLDVPPPRDDLYGPRSWELSALGFNERLDEVHAAVLQVKLESLEERIERRRQIAAWYDAALPDANLVKPLVSPGDRHVFMAYTILLSDREAARAALAAAGIATRVYYTPPLHLQPVFSVHGREPAAMPNAEHVDRSMLSVPVHPRMTLADARLVTDAFAGWTNRDKGRFA
jgi:dTDP-4-amino-4,6-dideoxygalactose transaminase